MMQQNTEWHDPHSDLSCLLSEQSGPVRAPIVGFFAPPPPPSCYTKWLWHRSYQVSVMCFVGGLKWARQKISPGLTARAKPSEPAFPRAKSHPLWAQSGEERVKVTGTSLNGRMRSGRERGARESELCLRATLCMRSERGRVVVSA